MPRLALVIWALWFFGLFVLRTILHWRNTGSTGIKGFHGGVGSLQWFAGRAVSLGFMLAVLGPIGALRGWPGGVLLVSSNGLHQLGALLALLGIVGGLVAQQMMGSSWRVGVDESETTTLVTDGLFAWARNPIFTSMLLSAAGFALLVPNVLVLLGCALTVAGIEAQVRVVEEPYLLKTHGRTYEAYAARVGRFLPGVGRLRRRGEPTRTASA